VGRWGGRAGQPGRPNRWSGGQRRRTGNRAEGGGTTASTFEVEEPGEPARVTEGNRRANRVHEVEAGQVEDDPDPRRRTFTGEAVRRWGGRTGQPGRTNRWLGSQGSPHGKPGGGRRRQRHRRSRSSNRATGTAGSDRRGSGPRATEVTIVGGAAVEPGNRSGTERSEGGAGQPARPTEKGIARRGVSSDGR